MLFHHTNKKNSIVSAFLLGLWIGLYQPTIVSSACQVLNAEGIDVTADMTHTVAVEGSNTDLTSTTNPTVIVQCFGSYSCMNFTMNDCPIIECEGSEACYFANFYSVTESVTCKESHSCHRTHVVFFQDDNNKMNQQQDVSSSSNKKQGFFGGRKSGNGLSTTASSVESNNPPTVSQQTIMRCHGRMACDVAFVHGVDILDCQGVKGCRKIDATAQTVICHDGDHEDQACMDLASFMTPCLHCQTDIGCSPYINQCRYQFPPEYLSKDSDPEQWLECDPEAGDMEKYCTADQLVLIQSYREKYETKIIEEELWKQEKGNNDEGNGGRH